MAAIRTLNYLARAAGVVAMLLGLALWTGRLSAQLNVHMALGGAVVLALWALSFLTFWRTRRAFLPACGLTWGVITIALGLNQAQLAVGDLQWIVQVAHLLVGVGAVVLATAIARSLSSHNARVAFPPMQ